MTIQANTRTNAALSRVERVRRRIINAPQEVCVERARWVTRAMAENWDADPLTRMSLALEKILANISVIIRDDELIVGCRTSKLKGAPLFPENKSRWLEGDTEGFDERVVQRALITAEEKRELLEDILPFWQGRTVEEYFESLLPEDVSEDMDKYIFTFMLEITYGVGHFTMNHARVLDQGLAGVMAEAQAKLDALDQAERAGKKGKFYEAVIRSLKAAVTFAGRYADLAAEMAAAEDDPVRKAELERIAEACRHVPEHRPRNFHEAVQAMYFIHLISQIETGGNSISLGRIDQVLYPYYKEDLQRGGVTPEYARELVALMFLKCNEIWNVLEEAYIPGGEGTEGKTTQNVTVGGVGMDGTDATNDLSYIILDSYGDIRTVQPNFGVRFGPEASAELWERTVDYTKDGVLVHFFNDEAIIRSLTDAGLTLEDARDYGVVGCLEPNAQGKTFGSTFAVQFSGIKCLELALSNGVDNIFGYQSGPETGDPADFKSFDDVWQAYDAQINHFVTQFVRGIACLDQAIAEMLPSPFASAMIDGPLDKALDLTGGGAIYNSTGAQFMGFSNVADSLTAVKQAVYDDQTFGIEDLAAWLADDWDEAEEQRTYLARKIPKYGNDNDQADAMAGRVMEHFCTTLAKHKNYRGGAFWAGFFSVGFHLAMGAFTGATPDGRHAGDILGNGVTPSNWAAISGPTAIMNSVTKLPLYRAYNGLNLNMRFSGKKLGTHNFENLIKGYFQRGGVQVQFNMTDSEVLRQAQADPENHRDLVVRISGYCGTFVDLSDLAQEEIIARSEFNL